MTINIDGWTNIQTTKFPKSPKNLELNWEIGETYETE